MAFPTPDTWGAVDAYFTRTLVTQDEALILAVRDQQDAGLPAIEVSPVAAKLLNLLVRISGARRVLEIGTLGGYSTIWLARALPEGGQVDTIEAEPQSAEVARVSIDRAGVGEKVTIHVGIAADVLPTLAGPYDLVFIDADKESTSLYLDWAARLGRPGTVVIVDNTARSGAVADEHNVHPQIVGVRQGLSVLGADPRFDATSLQTLDAKGWDGIAIGVLTDAVAH